MPLLLVVFGLSGAWIGTFAALEPLKPYVAAVALAAIGLGFWQIHGRRRPACDATAYCARPGASIVTKSLLWLATAIVLPAVSIDWWAPLLY